MNRSFPDHAPNLVRPEIDVGQLRVAANGYWEQEVCWRNSKAGLGQPMDDKGFKMLAAAGALGNI